MDRIFHNNIDLNYNQLIKSRVENVSSLPVGLGLDHKGMVVNFANKLYIWDGSEWNTWGDLSSINICCRNILTYYKTTNIPTSVVSLGEIDAVGDLTNDYCSYYGIQITGEWSVNPDDNDQGWNFSSQPIYCSLWYREVGQVGWDNYISKEVNYVTNQDETFKIDVQFIFNPETDVEIGVMFSEDPLGGGIYNPIANPTRFWKTVNITKCPKSSWSSFVDIPPFPKTMVNQFSGYVPSGTSMQLPFIGRYKVDMYVEVREYDYDGVTLVSTTSSQTLRIASHNTNLQPLINEIVDASGIFVESLTNPDSKWINVSLQGSIIIYIESMDDSKVYYEINLPNGDYSEVLGGYMVIKYLGNNKFNQFLEI